MIKNKGASKKPFSLQLFLLLLILWVSLIFSAFAVIFATYDSRVKFNQLETLRSEQNKLQTIWGQYLLEESTWASYGRVERLAKEKLSMRVPKSEDIIVVTP